MKRIPLMRGLEALVDDCDFEIVGQYKWYATRRKGSPLFYARRNTRVGVGRYRTVLMHRMIDQTPPGVLLDHANRNPLDNRRKNLRRCTRKQNNVNSRPRRRKGSTSGYKGVRLMGRKWRASIQNGRKSVHLGMFLTEKDAALAFDQASQRLHGEFAYLNFPKKQ